MPEELRIARAGDVRIAGIVSVAFVLAFSIACGGQKAELPRGPLADALAEAKKTGKNETTVRITGEAFDPGGFAQLLDDYSFVIVEVERSKPTTVTDRYIKTWHRVRVLEWLSTKAPVAFPSCYDSTLPSGMVVGADQLAVPILGGVVEMDGVRLVLETPQSPITLVGGEKIVAIVNACDSRVALLPIGETSILHLGEDGTLRSDSQSMPASLADLGSILTLEQLRNRIKEGR